jgi:putative CocE/NonD family hydrolase
MTKSYDCEARYSVRVDARVRPRMRDGVELAAKITRPDAEGKFPALVEYNPYRRLAKPLQDYRDEYPPVVPYLAARGYVIVQYEVRGTGNSGGICTDIYSEEERCDGAEMIEWAAAQPWCTGNVGMFGKSYSAVVQWHVAVQKPPHLKTIIVRSANDDVYTEWTNPGGCIRPYMFESYAPLMTAMNFAPPDIDIVGERWTDLWAERLEHNRPWGIAWMQHLLNDDYWKSRSLRPGYDRVRCPVYVIDGWADWYSTALLRAFSNLNVPKKVLIGPWGHYYAEEKLALPGPRIDTRREYLRWFDYWLKGIDTGIMDEPPVTIFVRKYKEPAPIYLEDKGFWRHENEWPPARARETALYLQAAGELGPDSPPSAAGDAFAYRPAAGITTGRHGRGNISPWAMPLDQRLDEAYALTYTTAPLEQAVEVTGNPAAILYVSSTADTAYFHVKLCDVAPDGTVKWVTDGGLNATHRDSHAEPEPLEPGRIYEIRVELKYVAYLFEAGHRIRVTVAGADFQNAWPTAKSAVHTVHRGGGQASHIVLPFVPDQNPVLPAPDFRQSPNPAPRLEGVPKPRHTVTHDLIEQTTTASFESAPTSPPTGINRSSFTVSQADPAQAVIRSSCEYAVSRPEGDIRVNAHCLTASDHATYRHIVDLEITVEGKRHFNKSWSVTVPRKLD